MGTYIGLLGRSVSSNYIDAYVKTYVFSLTVGAGTAVALLMSATPLFKNDVLIKLPVVCSQIGLSLDILGSFV